jgi:hypothetical protein
VGPVIEKYLKTIVAFPLSFSPSIHGLVTNSTKTRNLITEWLLKCPNITFLNIKTVEI